MKKMKKAFLFLLVVAVSTSMFFTSCDKAETNAAKKTLTSHEWKLKGFETADEEFSEVFNLMFSLVTATYKFDKDGTYVVTTRFLFASEKESGTWSVSEDGKEFTLDGETSEIIELTKDVFKIGPSKAIMGDYADDSQKEELEGFYDYTIVFEAD